MRKSVENPVVTTREFVALLGVSYTSFFAIRKQDANFPQPVLTSHRTVLYDAAEVIAYSYPSALRRFLAEKAQLERLNAKKAEIEKFSGAMS